MMAHFKNIARPAALAVPFALALCVAAPAEAQTTGQPATTGQQDAAEPGAGQPATRPQQQPIVRQPAAPTGIVEQGAWTVTPMIGFSFGGNLENSPLSLGLATAYNWTPRVSIEGELGHLRRAEQGVFPRFQGGVTTGNVNALYHFAAGNWAPYGTIGLGFAHSNANLDPFITIGAETPDRTVLTLNFGGGVKARVADRVNFRAGVRYFNGSELVPDFWRPYAGLSFIFGPRP
jgi:opacity protein-like surface antigen